MYTCTAEANVLHHLMLTPATPRHHTEKRKFYKIPTAAVISTYTGSTYSSNNSSDSNNIN